MDKCPINIPKILRMCEACIFSKEGLCDHPYIKGMSTQELKDTTRLLTNK